MPTIQHPDIRPVPGDPTAGPHVIHYWEVVDNSARDALTLVANDIGRVCRVGSAAPYTFFALTNNTGPAWGQVAVSFGSTAGTACEGNDSRLTDARTPIAHASTHQPGGADAIATAAAVELTDSTSAEGAATSLARSNHTHAHGNRGGGTLHAVATTSVAGFLSGADKTKLDAVYGFRSISTDASIAATDRFVLVDASAAARTPTLPAADTVDAGVGVLFKKQNTGTNTISLARTGADTIEGAGATYLLPGSDGTGRPAWMAVSDGTSAWWVV